jgi:hypothetical protein
MPMLLRRGEAVPAARLLEDAVSNRPDYVPSYNSLAKAYYQAGLPELAVATYEEVLRRAPSNPIALENLARLREAAGAIRALHETLAAAKPDATKDSDFQPSTANMVPKAEAEAYQKRLETRADSSADDTTKPPPPSLDAANTDTNAPPSKADSAVEGGGVTKAGDLQEYVRDLPHVTVEHRAGRLTLTGWTSGPKEREMYFGLTRILHPACIIPSRSFVRRRLPRRRVCGRPARIWTRPRVRN